MKVSKQIIICSIILRTKINKPPWQNSCQLHYLPKFHIHPAKIWTTVNTVITINIFLIKYVHWHIKRPQCHHIALNHQQCTAHNNLLFSSEHKKWQVNKKFMKMKKWFFLMMHHKASDSKTTLSRKIIWKSVA